MRLVHPTNESIDEIGKKVLKAIRVQDQNIDEIITQEALFDPVRIAIKAGRRQSVDPSRFIWIGFSVRRWQLVVASMAIIAFGVVGVAYIVQHTAPSREIVHETREDDSPIETPPLHRLSRMK
jgi:hypothetical protein